MSTTLGLRFHYHHCPGLDHRVRRCGRRYNIMSVMHLTKDRHQQERRATPPWSRVLYIAEFFFGQKFRSPIA